MAQDPIPSGIAPPDRLFGRTAALALGTGLALVVAVDMNLGQSSRRQTETTELALTSQDQTALAQNIVRDLDRLSLRDAGPKRVAIRETLVTNLEAFAAAEDELSARARALDPETATESSVADRVLAQLDTQLRRPQAEMTPLRAEGLSVMVETVLVPWTEMRTERFEAQTRRALAEGRTALRTALTVQIVSLVVVMLGVMLAATLRMRKWARRASKAEEARRFQMLHDPLTEMPNATYLHAYLARLAAGTERSKTQTAIVRVDLDKYEPLRRTLGQRTGDEIIRIAAKRIESDLRLGDFAAHLGHDDFVVVASGLEDGNAAAGIAQRIQTSLGKPVSIHGGTRRLSCSIGVTLIGDDEACADRILANAEIALGEAQASGHGQVRYFRESQRREVERREALYSELLSGLEQGQIVPYFQPQIELATGALTGFEALVRWRHPRRGLLSPAAFLDFAEQADLTDRIGEVVLAQSLAAIRAWDGAGLRVPRIGVNFAMGQLRDPRLIEKIKWEVERFDIDPSRLAVEVLETVLIKSDADLVVRNLQGLASSGFQVELDDFGTGHASIANLRRFRVDCIKIDRSFIFGIETSAEQQQLTASMIALAQALGIRTLAEGIETAAAVSLLRDLGCDRGQGYVIARPMSLSDTFGWLASFHPAEASSQAVEAHTRCDPNTP